MLRSKPTRDTAASRGAHRHSGLRHPEGDLGKGRPLDAARAGQLEERIIAVHIGSCDMTLNWD